MAQSHATAPAVELRWFGHRDGAKLQVRQAGGEWQDVPHVTEEEPAPAESSSSSTTSREE